MNRESDVKLVQDAVVLLGEGPLTGAPRDTVHRALQVMHVRLTGPDYDYASQIESLDRRDIPEASLSDLATWSTWVVRGERFSDGHIDAQIEVGLVGELLARLLELIGEDADGPRDPSPDVQG